jgi:hypothetical protein
MIEPGGNVTTLLNAVLSGDLTAVAGLIDELKIAGDWRVSEVYQLLRGLESVYKQYEYAGDHFAKEDMALAEAYHRYTAWDTFQARLRQVFWMELGGESLHHILRRLQADVDPESQIAKKPANRKIPAEFDSLFARAFDAEAGDAVDAEILGESSEPIYDEGGRHLYTRHTIDYRVEP